jgi:capsid portal protein
LSGVARAGVTPEKKSLSATERNEKHRTKFRKFVKVLDLRKCVFVDEMGSNLAMTRRYGRAAPGERVID